MNNLQPRVFSEAEIRYNRATYIVDFFQSIKRHRSIVWPEAAEFRADLIAAFGGPLCEKWHGIATTNQMWISFEFDEVVVALSAGYQIGYDEFGEVYGINGERIGIDVIKTKNGLIYVNNQQLMNDDWFGKIVHLAALRAYAPSTWYTNERLGLK